MTALTSIADAKSDIDATIPAAEAPSNNPTSPAVRNSDMLLDRSAAEVMSAT